MDAPAGDVDGDGFDDVLAMDRPAPPTNDAPVLVYHGSAAGAVALGLGLGLLALRRLRTRAG